MCPSSTQLDEFVAGRSANPEIAAHLRTCPGCRASAEDIRHNHTFLAELRPIAARHRRATALPSPARSPAMQDAPEGYEVRSLIARGGQGVVYEAVQKATKRRVALKVLSGGVLAGARQRRRFEREIELVAGLRHPNIVTVYDSGTTPDGRHFLAMEYVTGETLDLWSAERGVRSAECEAQAAPTFSRDSQRSAIARRRGPPAARGSTQAILSLFVKICDAVNYAHQRGIIHRDLKPANILVSHEAMKPRSHEENAGSALTPSVASAPEPRILDFGLAKALDGDAAGHAPTVTLAGEFQGTLAYAAPEQVQGDPGRIDTRTDVYAIGVMLYEALTGGTPYPTAGTISDVIRAIAEAEPLRPSTRTAGLDDELDTILLKVLAKDRERRYQSAGALADDLRNYLAGEAIAAKQDSAWYMVGKSISRHRRILATAAVGIVVLAVGAGFALYGSVNARSARLREGQERARAESESAKTEAIAAVLRAVIPPSDRSFSADGSSTMRRALDGLEARLEGGMLAARPDVEAAVRTSLGAIFRERAVPNVAEVEYRQALGIRLATLGDDHPDVAASLNDLAEVLVERNSLGEAETLCRRALEIRRRALGAEHATVAQSLDTLSRIRLRQGDAAEAGEHGRAALALRRALFGDEHVEVAASLNTLALIDLATGDLDSAEAGARQALAVRFKLLPDEHAQVGESLRALAEIEEARNGMGSADSGRLRSLAAALSGTGPAAGTERMWRDVLELKTESLGRDHPRVADTLTALGILLYNANRMTEAEAAHRQALDIYRRSYGARHLIVADTLTRLTPLRASLGCAEVVELLRERAEIYRARLSGKDDMGVGVTRREVADALMGCGDYEASEREYQASLAHFERCFGNDHREAARCRARYSELLVLRGRYGEAETMVRSAMETWTRLYRTQDSSWWSMAWCLGRALRGQDRFEEAEPLLLEAWCYFDWDETWGGLTQSALAELYEAWGRPEEAAAWRGDPPAPSPSGVVAAGNPQ